MTSAQGPIILDRHNALAVVRRLFGLGLLALGGVILTLTLIVVVQLMSRSQILEGRQVTLLAREVHTLLLDRQAGVRGYLLTTDTAAIAPEILDRTQFDRTLDSLFADGFDGALQPLVCAKPGMLPNPVVAPR